MRCHEVPLLLSTSNNHFSLCRYFLPPVYVDHVSRNPVSSGSAQGDQRVRYVLRGRETPVWVPPRRFGKQHVTAGNPLRGGCARDTTTQCIHRDTHWSQL